MCLKCYCAKFTFTSPEKELSCSSTVASILFLGKSYTVTPSTLFFGFILSHQELHEGAEVEAANGINADMS